MTSETVCDNCGKPISRRAKANVWNGDKVVCTPCLRELENAVLRAQNLLGMIGKVFTPWLVHDGKRELGPFTTDQLIDQLKRGKVDWMWNTWREGMKSWTPVARLFVAAALGRGRIELRDFGQGDGTYRP